MAMFLDLPKVPLPGPRTPPIIGAKLAVLRFLSDPVAGMLALHAEYGDLVALSRDDPGWLCAFGPALNRAVLTKPDLFPNFIESPIRTPAGSPAASLDINILAQNGAAHRQTRRMFMPAFTKQRLRSYAEQMVAISRRRVSAWPRVGALRAHEELTELSLEIAMRCLFGLSLDEARELSRDTVRFMELVLSPLAAVLPVAIPGTPYHEYLSVCDRVDAGLRALIERRRREGLGDDVLSTLIGARDDDGRPLPDAELVGQATTLINASHETTAMTLVWACLMLARNPELQRELGEELDAAIGDRPATLDDLERMPLLGWIVDETLRLFPPTPNLFFRRSSAPATLAGHELPAGVTLILSPLVTHRNPTLFPEPRRFLPYRWRDLELGPYDYIPFGAGVRRCLGAGFAAQATRLILASVFQQRRVSVPAPLQVDYRATGVVVGLERDIELELSTPAEGVRPPAKISGNIERLVDLD